MDKTYTVKFFTRDMVDGKINDEKLLSSFKSNKFIPAPSVGDTICLADKCPEVYQVKEVAYCYPESENEEYEYSIEVVLEVQ